MGRNLYRMWSDMKKQKQPIYIVDKAELIGLVNAFSIAYECTGPSFGYHTVDELLGIIEKLPDEIHVSKILQIMNDDFRSCKLGISDKNIERLMNEIKKIRIKRI